MFQLCLADLILEYHSRFPSDAGTFFTAETREAIRLHYKSVWSSCLYASALYLKQEGFGVKLYADDIPSTGSREMNDQDRFYLLLGKSKCTKVIDLPFLKCARRYEVSTPIRSVHTDTKYPHQYEVSTPIRSVHTDTKYPHQYKVSTPIRSVHTCTKCPH